MSLSDLFTAAQNVMNMFPALQTAITAMAVVAVGMFIYKSFMNRNG